MTFLANCKINIGLDILERRSDGYHSLSTAMLPIRQFYDVIEIEPIEGANVEFVSKGLVVDCPAEQNLCIKAYNLIKESFPALGAVRITLDKRVPFGAGLGGGSSDATAVLKGLNTLFELGLSEQRLTELAAQLGSDTPFFVANAPQLCTGRGEIMTPIELDLNGYFLVLIKPDINVSTKEAYAGVRPSYPTTELSSLLSLPIEQWQGRVKNDFEPHIFEAYPLLRHIKESLLGAGAIYAAMSGSGSTIYGIFESEEQAKSEQLESYSPRIFKL